MAINLESGRTTKGVRPEINVTPLVDVVLVLLIIFMVITPLLTKKFWVHTPKQEQEEVERQELANDPDPPLVLRISAEQVIAVNGVEIALEELPLRLQRMFAARDDHILFFDAADAAPFGYTVEVMDKAREGGAVTIAALTHALAQQAPDTAEVAAEAPAN